jgi:hypothetical protein
MRGAIPKRPLIGVTCLLVSCSGDRALLSEDVGQQDAALEADALGARCGTLMASFEAEARYLDAYTAVDGDVVTRPLQADDTQRWCFTTFPSGGGGGMSATGGFEGTAGAPVWVYKVQHRSFAGQYLDAHQTNGGKAVLRDAQYSSTQVWVVDKVGEEFRLKQLSSSRFLRGLSHTGTNYQVVISLTETPFTIVLEP